MLEDEPPAPAMDIGSPSGFRHVTSDTVQDLRAPGTGLFASPHWRPPVHGGAVETSMMTSGGLIMVGLGQPSSSSHDAEPGASDTGPSVGSISAGLERQVADSTVVTDDGDSEWEDDEGSRLFLDYHRGRQNGRLSFTPR